MLTGEEQLMIKKTAYNGQLYTSRTATISLPDPYKSNLIADFTHSMVPSTNLFYYNIVDVSRNDGLPVNKAFLAAFLNKKCISNGLYSPFCKKKLIIKKDNLQFCTINFDAYHSFYIVQWKCFFKTLKRF